MIRQLALVASLCAPAGLAACGGGGGGGAAGTPSLPPVGAAPTTQPSPSSTATPPAPSASGWQLTIYYTPVMSFYTGAPQSVSGCADLQCSSGNVPLGTFPSDFVTTVKAEGTGKIGPNSYLNWSANVGYWRDVLPRNAQGNALMPYLSAAADTSVAFGTTISIAACGADTVTKTPTDSTVCAALRSPKWVVSDRFTAGTVGQHVDLYVGEQTSANFTAGPNFIDASGATLTMSAPTPAAAIWKPAPTDSFQWILSTALDTSANANVYDLDSVQTTAANVASLHASGIHTVCYVNVGAYENWRPDAGAFPSSVIGAAYAGWPGENWLDIRRVDLLAPIMQARFDTCKAKGFDAIEPDNIDGYQQNTGFALSAADQIIYNSWLAALAHERGMSIALKNDDAQVKALQPTFDFALTEDCWKQGWCSNVAPFRAAGKAVFTVEYTDTTTASAFTTTICPAARTAGFTAILKNRNLDPWRLPCP